MIAFIGASVCLVLAGSVRRCVVLGELRLDALAGHGIPRESAVAGGAARAAGHGAATTRRGSGAGREL
jgi:hypothetical protein